MDAKTLEGTWEEIARHASELAGRRVRLTIFDERAESPSLDVVLAPLIEQAERLAGRASAPAETSDDGLEGVAEKYRRQGFDL